MSRIPCRLAVSLAALILIPVLCQDADGQIFRRGRNRCCSAPTRSVFRIARRAPVCNACNACSRATDVVCCWAPGEGQCVPAVPPAPDCGCGASVMQPRETGAAPETSAPAPESAPEVPQSPAPEPDGAAVPVPRIPSSNLVPSES